MPEGDICSCYFREVSFVSLNTLNHIYIVSLFYCRFTIYFVGITPQNEFAINITGVQFCIHDSGIGQEYDL